MALSTVGLGGWPFLRFVTRTAACIQDSTDYEQKVMTRSEILTECREMMRRFRIFERRDATAGHGHRHHHEHDGEQHHAHDVLPPLQQSKTVPAGAGDKRGVTTSNSMQQSRPGVSERRGSVAFSPTMLVRNQKNLRSRDGDSSAMGQSFLEEHDRLAAPPVGGIPRSLPCILRWCGCGGGPGSVAGAARFYPSQLKLFSLCRHLTTPRLARH